MNSYFGGSLNALGLFGGLCNKAQLTVFIWRILSDVGGEAQPELWYHSSNHDHNYFWKTKNMSPKESLQWSLVLTTTSYTRIATVFPPFQTKLWCPFWHTQIRLSQLQARLVPILLFLVHSSIRLMIQVWNLVLSGPQSRTRIVRHSFNHRKGFQSLYHLCSTKTSITRHP